MVIFKRFTAVTLVAAMSVSMLAGCSSKSDDSAKKDDKDATYTYRRAFDDSTITWNIHDMEVSDYITQYTEIPLWSLILNESADGYEWTTEMAEGEPEDITAEYAGNEKWGVPADATEGYAWRVKLNQDAKWEDGTKINADSYIYSMQQVLNPKMKNYHASDFYTSFPIYNAEYYAKSGQTEKKIVSDLTTGEYADYGNAKLYISFTQPTSAFWGYSGEDYYSGSESLYVNEAGEDLLTKYGKKDYVAVTDEVIKDVNYMLMKFWGESKIDSKAYLTMAFYDVKIPKTSFDEVGFMKTGDYELTIILSSPLTPYFFKYYGYSLALVNEEKYEAGKTKSGDMVKTNYGTSVDTYMSYGPYKLVSFQADKEWRLTKNENWYGWTDGEHEGMYQTTDIVCNIVEDPATQEQLFLQGKSDSLVMNAETLEKYQGSDYMTYSTDDTIWLLNINNDKKLLADREKKGINKTILTYEEFRKGISLSINRMEFVAQQGYGKEAFGLISDYYVSDVDTGVRYRDSEPAIETLKEYYGVDDISEITGYDLDGARKALVAGYKQALKDGVVKKTDKFEFDYPTWSNDDASVREVNFIQKSFDEATEGTELEGRITVNMVVSEDYYGMLDSGEYDLCMSGWEGIAGDPYELMQNFVTDDTSPQAYFGFNPESETLDIEINGKKETHTYNEWYKELSTGKYAVADSDTKNTILAAMELGLLKKYRDCPFWSTSTASLLSMKIAYPTYECVSEVGFGGIRFMTYNYTDEEWEAYCKENNNQLNYQ